MEIVLSTRETALALIRPKLFSYLFITTRSSDRHASLTYILLTYRTDTSIILFRGRSVGQRDNINATNSTNVRDILNVSNSSEIIVRQL